MSTELSDAPMTAGTGGVLGSAADAIAPVLTPAQLARLSALGRERRDEPENRPPTACVAPDVCAKREHPRGERHEAHRLAEQGTRLDTAERRLNGCAGG